MTLELQLPTAQGGRRGVPVRQVSAAGGRDSASRTAHAAVHVVAEAMDTARRGMGLAQERLDALFRVAGVA